MKRKGVGKLLLVVGVAVVVLSALGWYYFSRSMRPPVVELLEVHQVGHRLRLVFEVENPSRGRISILRDEEGLALVSLWDEMAGEWVGHEVVGEQAPYSPYNQLQWGEMEARSEERVDVTLHVRAGSELMKAEILWFPNGDPKDHPTAKLARMIERNTDNLYELSDRLNAATSPSRSWSEVFVPERTVISKVDSPLVLRSQKILDTCHVNHPSLKNHSAIRVLIAYAERNYEEVEKEIGLGAVSDVGQMQFGMPKGLSEEEWNGIMDILGLALEICREVEFKP